jgi:hypothetical protein
MRMWLCIGGLLVHGMQRDRVLAKCIQKIALSIANLERLREVRNNLLKAQMP